MSAFDNIPENISFPKTEEDVAALWEKIDAFHTQLKRTEGLPEYNFYDGPPFATGLPHYGHILAGTIKDTVTRYAAQNGYHVTRRFGWDCHGLPIEFEIDKELGVKTRDDVLAMGIPKYNAACRGIVMRYSGEWEKVVTRLGRWIDFKNDYKTLDTSFMESVWWVFKSIHEKGFVYRGFKVMPYSTACTTPLSNFEAGLDYRNVSDPAVVVSFPLVDEPDVALVAWTTTPWTLPSNLGLVVNPDLDYVKLTDKKTNKTYIMCAARTVELYSSPDLYEVKATFKGKDLKDKRYTPLFPYFAGEAAKGAFRVLVDSYVTDTSGTGIVHSAPAFGEDDYRVCLDNGIIQKGDNIICPVDANGRFTSEVTDFQGKHVKDADKEIIKHLKGTGRLVHSGTIVHSYPFCWRSSTPLIYKAVPSWFIAVERVRDKLAENNKKSYWVPEYVQEKRFHNWLVDANDWAVSRNRFWGTPIPIWISDDGEEIQVIGSIAELEQLSGRTGITDLHRENIDSITIPSKRGAEFGVLKRIDEVFDCWFESGSMPYAQVHYPFENKELFEKTFPADFIAEGIDQTRGWFYTLLVISTILFDKPPFKNLIVNGLVLASDGKKMSKRLKNYPDPMFVVNEYGADALRLYLINSPVVRGESLKFQEKGVRDIIKEVFLPWFNVFRFFSEAVKKFNKQESLAFKPDTALALSSENIMDKWILAAVNELISFVRTEMAAYRLYTVLPQLVKFIEQLTNWYVRLNRRRLKGSGGELDARKALSTMFEVLYTLTKAMAPFTPFFTEYLYQHLRKLLPENEREESVHYLPFPTPVEAALNARIVESVGRMQAVIQLGRAARDRRTLPIKFPLTRVVSINKNPQFQSDVESLKAYIIEELNVREVALTDDESQVKVSAKPDNKVLGARLKGDFGKVSKAIQQLTPDQIKQFHQNGFIELEGHRITSEELLISREFKGDTAKQEAAWDNDCLIVLDLEVDENLRQEGLAREVINRVQRLRKKAGIHPTDPIEVFYDVVSGGKDNKDSLDAVIKNQAAFIFRGVGVPLTPMSARLRTAVKIIEDTSDVVGSKLRLNISVLTVGFSDKALTELAKGADATFVEDIKFYFVSRDQQKLLNKLEQNGGKYNLKLNGVDLVVELGKHIFRSVNESVAHQ